MRRKIPSTAALISFEAAAREGNLDARTDDVETLTGRKQKPFRAFFEKSRDALLA